MAKNERAQTKWLRKLCEGSTSELWLGRHRDAKVLLKLLTQGDGAEPVNAGRREREAHLHASLGATSLRLLAHGEGSPPNGASGRAHYLVLEHVDGVSFEHFVNELKTKQKLLATGADAVRKQMLHVLSSLHRLGVLHRDPHPRNFLMTAQGLRVFDLGYAAAPPKSESPRPPRHRYEALDYAAGSAGNVDCDYYGVGVLGLELLECCESESPALEEHRKLLTALCAPQMSRLVAVADQIDETLRGKGAVVGLRSVTPEPLQGLCHEPPDYVEVAACLDMLRFTFGFPDRSIMAARMAPGPDHPPAFGFDVIDPVNRAAFRIELVANCGDLQTFWRDVSAWLVDFGNRYSEGQRETLYRGTTVRAAQDELLAAMQSRGMIIPALGASGVIKSMAFGAAREVLTKGHH